MASRKEEENTEYRVNPNPWMLSFADLLSILLSFFVLLLTMKSMDTGKARDTFSQTFGALDYAGDNGKGEGDGGQGHIKSSVIASSEALEKVFDLLEGGGGGAFEGKVSFGEIRQMLDVSQDERGVIISLESDHLFDSGEALINQDRLTVLDSMARIFKYAENDVLIMGHTDGTPVSGGRFASNGELSFQRALNVLKYFTDVRGLSPGHFAAGGFGDALPLVPNDTDAHRAKNRRIEFILRKSV